MHRFYLLSTVRKGMPTRALSRTNATRAYTVSNTYSAQVRRGFSTTQFARSATVSAALKPSQSSSVLEHAAEAADAAADAKNLPVVSMDDREVAIGWEDSRTWSRYHHIWLRDHCRCPNCYHQITKQRLVNTFEIPIDIKPTKVQAVSEGLEVTWPSSPSHIVVYPWSWLKEHSYNPPVHKKPPTSEKVLWGSKIAQDPPSVTYEEVMAKDNEGLYKWLYKIDRFGFCFVTGVPTTAEATEELSTRIGFIRETQYGKFWDFTSDLAKGDTAYTTLALGAHTDNTYFTDPCGIQLFHLLSHTEGTGGATLLVDGFYVASILKELHPKIYSLLSRVPVPAHAAGEPSALYRPTPLLGYPVLGHERGSGELAQVRWNNDDRSVMTSYGGEDVEEWYHAIRTWNKLLTSPDSEYWVQLTPGTAVAVNNHRVLHGRSGFDGKRRMCGAYIGVDEFRSKLDTLAEKFTPDSVTQQTSSYATVNGRSIWSSAL